jgi:hypothetical protein
MGNALAPAQVYLALTLEKYKLASFTARLDSLSQGMGSDLAACEIKIRVIQTQGLGNYDRANGYPSGSVTVGWETKKLAVDRAQSFELDRVDSMEVLNVAIAEVFNDFMEQHVAPEIDAYRVAKYAAGAGTVVEGSLAASTLIAAIDEAIKAMDNAGVPAEGRALFVNNNLLPAMNAALSRVWGSEGDINRGVNTYNGVPVIFVPPTRFYSGIVLSEGGAFGYANAGEPVNFLLIGKNALWQAVKVQSVKYITAEQNQKKDAFEVQFRLFHDAGVSEQNAAGVYCHKQAPPPPPSSGS